MSLIDARSRFEFQRVLANTVRELREKARERKMRKQAAFLFESYYLTQAKTRVPDNLTQVKTNGKASQTSDLHIIKAKPSSSPELFS